MNARLAKEMMDACYTAKRARDLLPALPKGVTASYIHYLEEIREAEEQGRKLRVSDISDSLGIKRPGITRTVNEMEQKGYIKKMRSEEDGRIVYLAATEKGKSLSRRFDIEYFEKLVPLLETISEEEARMMISTVKKLYEVMSNLR